MYVICINIKKNFLINSYKSGGLCVQESPKPTKKRKETLVNVSLSEFRKNKLKKHIPASRKSENLKKKERNVSERFFK